MYKRSEQAALGFRAHSGWAVVVAVGGLLGKPVVLERRRIVTADAGIAGSKQPYHAGERLGIEEAEALIGACRASSLRLATDAVSGLLADLRRDGITVVGAGILFASGRALPDLEAVLKSHALIHTAEGEFSREVLVRACEACSLPVTRVKEREVWNLGSAALGLGPTDLERVIGEIGRSLGPPWRQDEKFAAMAGWVALEVDG
jgi:hypothetical protein